LRILDGLALSLLLVWKMERHHVYLHGHESLMEYSATFYSREKVSDGFSSKEVMEVTMVDTGLGIFRTLYNYYSMGTHGVAVQVTINL